MCVCVSEKEGKGGGGMRGVSGQLSSVWGGGKEGKEGGDRGRNEAVIQGYWTPCHWQHRSPSSAYEITPEHGRLQRGGKDRERRKGKGVREGGEREKQKVVIWSAPYPAVWGPVKVLTSSLRANYLTLQLPYPLTYRHTQRCDTSRRDRAAGRWLFSFQDDWTVLISQLSSTFFLRTQHSPSMPPSPASTPPPLNTLALFPFPPRLPTLTSSYALPLRLCGLL